ncbi:MAG: ADP-ribosylation factor-like protein, partial [Oceanococcus sp.]
MKFILECYEFLEKEEIYCLEKIRKHTTGLLVRGNFPITEISMRYFSENLKNLTYLNLEINKIGNEGARYIAKYLANLTSLNLKYNNISDEGAHYLSEKLSKLISLDLGLNKIGDEGARYIAQNLPNLTYLNLDCNEIGDEGARYIAQNLPKLTSLNLNRNKIGDAGVRYIAQNLTELTSLDLWSNKIGDESARHIAQNLTKLTSLNLWSNKIGDEGARHIAQNLTKLTSLNLESNEIGDEGARYIAENLRGLTSLALSINNPVGIPNETLRNIKALRAYFQAQGVEKKVLNTQVRAMLIGEPEAGKTTLLKALMKTPFVLGAEKRTHGLERGQIELKQINHHDFEMQDLQLDIWDMGGQSLQLMMHGFFFHSDAIFLLLINEQSSFSALKLWLNQLKYQRHGDGNAKIIVIPVLNPTKNTTKKISGTLIERLKTEFAHNFDWMRPIVVDLADEIHPNVGDLTNALRVILASFPLKEYWESIDDIASDLGNWPEDYLRSSRFIDKLRDRSVFKKSFSRISGKVREENPNEVFDEREFASLIRGILELKGIITALENPDFVILNPAWIEKGL